MNFLVGIENFLEWEMVQLGLILNMGQYGFNPQQPGAFWALPGMALVILHNVGYNTFFNSYMTLNWPWLSNLLVTLKVSWILGDLCQISFPALISLYFWDNEFLLKSVLIPGINQPKMREVFLKGDWDCLKELKLIKRKILELREVEGESLSDGLPKIKPALLKTTRLFIFCQTDCWYFSFTLCLFFLLFSLPFNKFYLEFLVWLTVA